MRRPGASLSAVFALSVGISLTATTFSIIDAGILRPLPFDEPRTLVHVSAVTKGNRNSEPIASADLAKWRQAQTAFEDLGAYRVGTVTVSDVAVGAEACRAALAEAISFATDGAVRGASFSGTSNWTFMARQPRKTERTVEVFNLSTLVRRTGSKGPEVDQPELDDIKRMIVETIGQLKQGEVNEDRPDFVFHPGANLLIVTGTPMAIEVARKVIAALPTRPRIWPPPLDNTTTPRHE